MAIAERDKTTFTFRRIIEFIFYLSNMSNKVLKFKEFPYPTFF